MNSSQTYPTRLLCPFFCSCLSPWPDLKTNSQSSPEDDSSIWNSNLSSIFFNFLLSPGFPAASMDSLLQFPFLHPVSFSLSSKYFFAPKLTSWPSSLLCLHYLADCNPKIMALNIGMLIPHEFLSSGPILPLNSRLYIQLPTRYLHPDI